MENIYQYLMILSSDILSRIFFKNIKHFREESIEDARLVVKEFIKDSTSFWSVDLSNKRKVFITELFVRKSKVNLSLLEDISKKNSYDSEKYWIINMSMQYILSQDEFDDSVTLKAKNLFEIDYDNEEWVEQEWLDSVCLWDRYLKSLTPDQPTYLVDFALEEFEWIDQTQLFFFNLERYFDDSEIDHLKGLVNHVATKEIGYKEFQL